MNWRATRRAPGRNDRWGRWRSVFVGWSFASTWRSSVSYQRHDSPARDEQAAAGGLTRARLLRNTAALALAGMSPALLSQATAFGAAPVKGGTLRVGCVGAGTAETLNPFLGVTPIDQCRLQNLYDPLVGSNADLSRGPGL